MHARSLLQDTRLLSHFLQKCPAIHLPAARTTRATAAARTERPGSRRHVRRRCVDAAAATPASSMLDPSQHTPLHGASLRQVPRGRQGAPAAGKAAERFFLLQPVAHIDRQLPAFRQRHCSSSRCSVSRHISAPSVGPPSVGSALRTALLSPSPLLSICPNLTTLSPLPSSIAPDRPPVDCSAQHCQSCKQLIAGSEAVAVLIRPAWGRRWLPHRPLLGPGTRGIALAAGGAVTAARTHRPAPAGCRHQRGARQTAGPRAGPRLPGWLVQGQIGGAVCTRNLQQRSAACKGAIRPTSSQPGAEHKHTHTPDRPSCTHPRSPWAR